MALEIERKWLIDFPLSKDQWVKLIGLISRIIIIKQTYISPKNKDGKNLRIRKSIVCDNKLKPESTEYIVDHKLYISKLSKKEVVNKISEQEYYDLMTSKCQDHGVINKIRFEFKYEDQLFELDYFLNKELSGLVILELELDSEEQKVNLPEFLTIKKEVTKEAEFSNFELGKTI